MGKAHEWNGLVISEAKIAPEKIWAVSAGTERTLDGIWFQQSDSDG